MDFRYEQNEARYRRLVPLRRAVDYAGRSFDQFDLRTFLESVLAHMTFPSERPRAFEYGTGTGAGACFLAARGFAVDAIDISPTAIALARRFARDRKLSVSFEVADIRRTTPTARYDLVVDNFCLQWLVGEDERRRVLATVRSLLAPGASFVVGTVPWRDGRDFGSDRFDSSTGVVYRPLPDPGSSSDPDAVCIESRWFVPWRRIVTSPASLRTELEGAGFRVTHQEGARCLCVSAGETSGPRASG